MNFLNLLDKINKLQYDIARDAFPYIFMRPMFKFIKENYKSDKGLTGVEIGVSIGRNAHNIVLNFPIKKLYLVDPYELYNDFTSTQSDWVDKMDAKKTYDIAVKRLKAFDKKVVFVKKKSEDAVLDIPSGLDFVYIDGVHNYEYVKKDIELYYPKVKKGGVIGGDDFCADFIGLVGAVTEFADKKNVKLYGDNRDWWIVKEE